MNKGRDTRIPLREYIRQLRMTGQMDAYVHFNLYPYQILQLILLILWKYVMMKKICLSRTPSAT